MSSKTPIFVTGATGKHSRLALRSRRHIIGTTNLNASGPCQCQCLLSRFRRLHHDIGYIGGAVLSSLLNHPRSDTFDITALIRSPEKANTLNDKFGVKAVVGSHAELDKIEELAEGSHVVFHLVCTYCMSLLSRHRLTASVGRC